MSNLTRTSRGIPVVTLILMCLLSAVLGGLSCGYLVTIYPVVFIVIASACTSFAVCAGNSLIPFVSVLPAYGIALLVTQRPDFALFSIAFALCAVPMILISRGKIGRLTGCVAIGAVLAAHLVLYTYLDIKTVYPDRSALSVLFEYLNTLSDNLVGAVSSEEGMQELAAYFRDAIRQVLMVMPGFLFAVFEAAGFLVTLAFRLLSRIFAKEDITIPKDYSIRVSVVSSVVLIAAAAVSLIGFHEVVQFSALNLFIAMLPGFVWCGVREYIRAVKKIKRPVFMIVSLVFLALSGIPTALMVMGVGGAAANVARALRDRKNKKNDEM